MKRILLVGIVVWAAGAAPASAQVYIRAPFVRVQTGPGVFVQAPFVTIATPPPVAPVYVVPPPSIYIPPTPAVAPRIEILPTPAVAPQPTPVLQGPASVPPPPAPAAVGQPLTLNQFAASFKPRAGTFDVTLINPITNQPTNVRFTLPEGRPKRVIVDSDEVEFRYGLFHFVRIEFKANGAQVVTRMGR